MSEHVEQANYLIGLLQNSPMTGEVPVEVLRANGAVAHSLVAIAEAAEAVVAEVRRIADAAEVPAAVVTLEDVAVPTYAEFYAKQPALRDVALERATHEARGWTAEHDAEHGVQHLTGLALNRMFDVWQGRTRSDDRSNLVKAASLLVAAIELLDATHEGPTDA